MNDKVVTIEVPSRLVDEIEALTTAAANRTGEPVEAVRRGVELAALTRGVESLRKEFGR